MSDDPALAFNEEDGTAADPIAFRDAIMADPDKRAALLMTRLSREKAVKPVGKK